MCINPGGEAKADSPDSLQQAYIKQYRDLARQQMAKHRIPASITMAQALLESAAGSSPLAKEAHNHFGIKCGNGWAGDSIHIDDDRPKDCFRKYLHPDSSYADRVWFLARPRYRFLFDSLSITDYRGWAYGLKRAGYATDTLYPVRLIQLIERLGLQSLDSMPQEMNSSDAPASIPMVSMASTDSPLNNDLFLTHNHLQMGVKEGIIYVTKAGDSPLSVSQKTGVALYKLQIYNHLNLSVNQFEQGRVLILNRYRYNKLRQTTSN
jgi:hypothetical protein